MALLQKGTIFAIDVETTIGAGQPAAWANGDVVSLNADSSMSASTESIERNVLTGTFLPCQSLAGNESVSGSLNIEFGIVPNAGLAKGKLKGHLLYLAGLGLYTEAAGIVDTVTKTISIDADPVASPSPFDLYRLSKPTDTRTTLCVREIIGGNGNTVLDYKGVVVDSIALNLTSGQILTAAFTVSGTGYSTATGQAVLTNQGCGANPFVVKSAKLSVAGTEINAQDVSLTITNTIADRMAISSTGISDKVTTAKTVELSYTLDMVDVSAYTKLKNNDVAEIFIELNNGVEQAFIYLPKVNYKTVEKGNDSDVITLQVSSSAYPDANGEAFYLATSKL